MKEIKNLSGRTGKAIAATVIAVVVIFALITPSMADYIMPMTGPPNESTSGPANENNEAGISSDTGSGVVDPYADDIQLPPMDLGKDDVGYLANLYDNMSGLLTTGANCLEQTKEGFIWIGTYAGLIRYDGNRFEQIGQKEGISSVMTLYADDENRLWIGMNDNGAAVLENGVYRKFGKADGLESLSIHSIVGDNQGHTFMGTTRGIVYVDKHMQMHVIDDPRIKNEYIRMLASDENGVIYGVTKEDAIFTIKDHEIDEFHVAENIGISDARVIAADPFNENYVYIGTGGTELYYGKLDDGFSDWKRIGLHGLNYVHDIRVIGNKVWLCTESGIGYVRNNRVTIISNVPMVTSVTGVMVDYLGNFWFVSSKQGVMKVVPNRFLDLFEQYHLEDKVVNTTCMDGDRLYVGLNSGGITVLDDDRVIETVPIKSSVSPSGRSFRDKNLVKLLSDIRIRSIVRDSKGRLWFSGYGDIPLVIYDNGKVTRFTEEDGLPSSRVRFAYECADGSMAVVCTGGLAIIKNDKITKVYDDEDGLTFAELLTVSQMDSGELVVGTDGGGIYFIDPNGEVSHIGTDDGLCSDVIMRIKRDRTRDLQWLVFSNSIAYMKPDHEIVTIADFPYNNNFDMYENAKDEMWVLTSNGIYVVEVEDLIKNEKIRATFQGMDNGLPYITTSNSYSELTDNGDLYICGSKGVTKVNIDTTFEEVHNFKMAVPYVDVDGRKIYPDKNGVMNIPSDAQRLTVYSYVYNYSLMNPLVSYRLEGLDEEANTVRRDELDSIAYTNLKGGSYEFVLQLLDNENNVNKEIRIPIVKQKGFWEKSWVHLLTAILGAVLIGVCVWLYIRERTKRFLQKEREQKQLISEIVQAFAKVIDMKDNYTNGHSSRVAKYTAMLTRELGYDEDTVEKYYNIAMLHDIGKIAIPQEVLNKPGKLTDREFKIIKSHAAKGYQTLKDISIMPELAVGAGAHHERPDGKGYPKGLKGDEIPRVAQIIAVADTFDAMYSDRPYRKRMNFEKAVSIMTEIKGTQLTEDVVDAFLRLVAQGEFIHPDDKGGGTMEDIDNIHKKQKMSVK